MKKTTTILGILVLSSLLTITSPVMAQSSDNTTGTTATTDHNDDDTGKWGLAGLLGLVGLLGLRKKDDNDRHRTNVTR